MLSNTIRTDGNKSEILSGFYAIDGIDRSGNKYSSRLPVIGRQAGFSGFNIAVYEGHDWSLSVAGKQEERDNNNRQARHNDIFNQSLSSRRIYPIQGFTRLFFIHPFIHSDRFPRSHWLNMCSPRLPQYSGYCQPRPCVIGDLAIFVQTGWITQWPLPYSKKRQSLAATKRKTIQTKETVKKEHSWQVGNHMIVGGKAIFPDKDTVFFRLYFDYYARNTNYPYGQHALSRKDQLHWPACGDHAITSYDEWCRNLMTCCTDEYCGDCWADRSEREPNIPGNHPDFFHSAYFFGKESKPDFVIFRKPRLGLWNIKLLTALLLFVFLIAGLDAFTGIHGYVSTGSLSALELLSGLIITLTTMVITLFVCCALIKSE